LAGGFLFFASAFFMYMSPYALGASGAVMALAGAAVTLAPDYRVMLLLLGEVRLKYIVLVMVLLDLISIANQDNTGGHVAHIGGFATGIFLVSRLRDGQDLLDPVHELWLKIQSWFTPSARPRPMRRPAENTRRRSATTTQSNTSVGGDEPSFQEKLDAILDKIRETGYENLTQEEKDFLFRASKK
jgi:Rhomboid family